MFDVKKLADMFIRFGNELNELSLQQGKTGDESEKDKLLTKQEVLDLYSMFSESGLYRATTYGGLPSYKINSHRLYKISDIESWIDSKKETDKLKPFVGF